MKKSTYDFIYLASPECRQLLYSLDGCLAHFGLTLDDLFVDKSLSTDSRFLAIPINAYVYLATGLKEFNDDYMEDWVAAIEAETSRLQRHQSSLEEGGF